MSTEERNLDNQSYVEGFTPRKVLRRSPLLNRTFDKENDPMQPGVNEVENKNPISPHAKTAKKSSPLEAQRNRRKRGRPSVHSKGSTLGKRTRSQLKLDDSDYASTGDEATDSRGCAPDNRNGSKEIEAGYFTPRKGLQHTPGVQDSCFTPSRSLQRTPPTTALAVTKEKKGAPDSCFTPSKSLQRSPPANETGALGVQSSFTPRRSGRPKTPRVLDKVVKEEVQNSSLTATTSGNGLKRSLSVRDGAEEKRGVQATCFTPKKTLKRCLPSAPESQADAILSTSKWEITQTPLSTSNAAPGSNAAATAAQSSSSRGSPYEHEVPQVGPVPLPPHQTAPASLPPSQNETITKVVKGKTAASNRRSARKKTAFSPRGAKPVQANACAEDIPPTTKCDIPRTPVAHQSKTSVKTVDVPVAVSDEANVVPPSSHWEIPRTPPLSTSPVSATSNKAITSMKDDNPQRVAVQASDILLTSLHDTPAAPPSGPPRHDTPAAPPSGPPCHDTPAAPPSGPPHVPSPKRTPSFEIAANIIQSISAKSPAAVVVNSSHEEIRDGAVGGSKTASSGLPPANSSAASIRDLTPPPTSHWEIPRTPMEAVHYESVQLSPSRGLSRTPSRIRVPVHPLSVTNSSNSGEIIFPSSSKISPSKMTGNSGIKIQQLSVNPTHPANLGNTSSLTVAGQMTLPGLQCTDEDLAYLERIKNLARLKELQARSDRLAREVKAATEEKEQLEHAAKKIQSDIDVMRGNYRDTVCVLRAMIEEPLLTALPVVDSQACDTNTLPAVREGDLEKLKRLNLQAASQIDRLDKKLEAKQAELESKRKFRKEDERRKLLEDKISNSEAQKNLLDQKQAGLVTHLSSVEEEARLLRCELARLDRANAAKVLEERPATKVLKDRSARLQEKAVVEERLKILIRRCDLYCRSHRMLQDMGLIKRPRKY